MPRRQLSPAEQEALIRSLYDHSTFKFVPTQEFVLRLLLGFSVAEMAPFPVRLTPDGEPRMMHAQDLLSWMSDKEFYRPPKHDCENWHVAAGRRWGRSTMAVVLAACEEALDPKGRILVAGYSALCVANLEGIDRATPRFVRYDGAPVFSSSEGTARGRTAYASGERLASIAANTFILDDPSAWSANKTRIATPIAQRAERVIVFDCADTLADPEDAKGFLRIPTWFVQDLKHYSTHSRLALLSEFGGYANAVERVTVPRRLVELLARKGLTCEGVLLQAFELLEPGLSDQ